VCRDITGIELVWSGAYRAMVAPEHIESTEVFEGFPEVESVNTMTLTETDGVTTLQTLVRHKSKANRNGHVQSGMEGGMEQTFDRLDDERARSRWCIRPRPQETSHQHSPFRDHVCSDATNGALVRNNPISSGDADTQRTRSADTHPRDRSRQLPASLVREPGEGE
jgi:Activator of Hsp90 ATPase homolog 1-like protein